MEKFLPPWEGNGLPATEGWDQERGGFLHPQPRGEFQRKTQQQTYPDMFRRIPGLKSITDFLRCRLNILLMPLRGNHG